MKTKTTTKQKSLADLIKQGKYIYVNSDLTEANFPRPDVIQTEGWQLIKMDKSFSSQEALARIKAEGCRPANAWELAQWKVNHGDTMRPYQWVLALGQLWRDARGDHRVPFVGRRSDVDFEFRLGYFEGGWDGGGCLLVFRDSASPRTLGSLETPDALHLETLEKQVAKIEAWMDTFITPQAG